MIQRTGPMWAAVVIVLLLATSPVHAAGVDYSPPVSAPISDHFRAPTSLYGSGNRGLEYATQPGAVVRASGDGIVAFAGVVAGRLVVSITHVDGLRTTYSGLTAIEVRVGLAVQRGQRVGQSGNRLHFGVLAGPGYLNPEHLFQASAQSVRLVPVAVSKRTHHQTIHKRPNWWIS